MSRKSVSDLLKDAVAYKEQGNALFKAGEYRKAVTKYATVFAFTRGLPGSKRSKSSLPVDIGKTGGTPLDPALENEASELERLCEQNIATCYIKLNSGAEALEHANKALSLNPSAAKSLLRKGQALMLLSNYEGGIIYVRFNKVINKLSQTI
jgi:tetratricopeptide (TPR) repeat protein